MSFRPLHFLVALGFLSSAACMGGNSDGAIQRGASTVDITIANEEMRINGTAIGQSHDNIAISSLRAALGKPDRSLSEKLQNTIHIWDELGVYAYEPNEASNAGKMLQLSVALNGSSEFEFWPEKLYGGAITVDGMTIGPDTTAPKLEASTTPRWREDDLLPDTWLISYGDNTWGVSVSAKSKGEVEEFVVEWPPGGYR